MGKIRVKNVEGHFENPSQGTWIAYWEEKTGRKATECNDVTCHETDDLVGGHVEKEGNEDNIFLTTLCEDCIKTTVDYGVLVNEKHLIVETHRKE